MCLGQGHSILEVGVQTPTPFYRVRGYTNEVIALPKQT